MLPLRPNAPLLDIPVAGPSDNWPVFAQQGARRTSLQLGSNSTQRTFKRLRIFYPATGLLCRNPQSS